MTQENPRDPGKIAQGFPSRAQSNMQNLRDFHQSVMAEEYVANNPESEAAFRAVASGGKTSERSPARPSAAQRQSLTGVRENTSQQGWHSAVAMPHLCFPPDQYPQGSGPGSRWVCRCDAVWEAHGVAWVEYPVTPKRLELLQPERWFYISGGQRGPEEYKAQAGLYDWRPLGPYYVKLYRAILDALQGKPSQDWRDME